MLVRANIRVEKEGIDDRFREYIKIQLFEKFIEKLKDSIEIQEIEDRGDVIFEIECLMIDNKDIVPLFKFLRDNYEQHPITKDIYFKLVNETKN